MSIAPLRIVVADDEVDMRDFLSKVLPRLGYQVVAVAADGNQLLAECRRTMPDLIITDLKMPNRDGLSAVEELWRDRSIPVVFISAFPQELAESPLAKSPLTTLLVKPVKKADLKPAIELILRRGPSPMPPGGFAGPESGRSTRPLPPGE
uniref:Response regulator n=1 Tax=Schlesneria paludicola TaxID=360056 RepID=A0A7C2JYE0_9PLAN